MKHPATKAEIVEALESNARMLADYFMAIPERTFFDGDPEHWSPAHHLVHLTRTSAAIERGLRAPDLPARPPRPWRSYAEVRDLAAAAVASTSRATLLEMGRTVTLEPGVGQAAIVSSFTEASARLRAAIEGWDEEAMERYELRHPLLGVLSVGETLLFAVVHERHHLRGVQNRVGALGR